MSLSLETIRASIEGLRASEALIEGAYRAVALSDEQIEQALVELEAELKRLGG